MFTCVAGKKRKSQSELPKAIKYLQELERSSEERQEEREIERRKMELEAEERRQKAEWKMEERKREAERKHEERMNYMFMNFFREVMGRPGTDTPTPSCPLEHTSDELCVTAIFPNCFAMCTVQVAAIYILRTLLYI